MRILRLECPATLRSSDAKIKLESVSVRDQLYDELEHMTPDLTEAIRKKIIAYFPADYTAFVRLELDRRQNNVKVLVWIDDPNIRWPAGLLARRAWKLSVPVLAHAASAAFSEKIQGIEMDVGKSNARVASFAPARIWSDPIVVILLTAALTTFYWLYLEPSLMARLISAPTP